jgi:hypothetical protein
MTAAAPGRAGDDVRRVSEAELAPMVEAAVGVWTEALGEGDARLAALEGMTVTVGDRPSQQSTRRFASSGWARRAACVCASRAIRR